MTELPTTFGKYFLTEKLATGGMAEIYLAKLVGPGGFEKQLVIKQIHPRLSGQRHFVDLFVTEAKTLVTLTHGNIVPVYELGVIDDTYFIAMEYIDGPTLYRLTEALARKSTRMDPPLAAWVCARILEGLDYAHRKGEGVIHRDLSPRNVMLSRDGDVKLVDFGIAVTLGAADDGGTDSAPTGSFPYMSPEQVRRESLDGQTDLFSAGVLLWEMLAGRRLFARSDPDATLAAVTTDDIPRPSSIRPDIPAKLDEVVMRALERDRGARWPSAGEMLAQLQRYLYSLDQPPGPRELAAVVAKHCPPETRRLPTHAEPPGPGGSTDLTPPPAGPRTAVIPREGTAQGKPRARTETFATNVQLEQMLDPRATPLLPIPAIAETKPASPTADTLDEDEPPPRTSHRAIPRAERSGVSEAVAGDDDDDGDAAAVASDDRRRGDHDERDDREARADLDRRDNRAELDNGAKLDNRDDVPARRALPVPGRTPPGRGLLLVAAAGTLVLGAVALVMFLRSRAAFPNDTTTDGMPAIADVMPVVAIDAPGFMIEPAALDTMAAPVDAITADGASDAITAPPADTMPAAAPADARVTAPPRDAGIRARPDAAIARRPADAAPRATGTATLKIGATPWGEVVIDGVARGRTPLELTLPAGKHVVEVIFRGDDPPRTSKKTIELMPGESELVHVDFTR